VAFATVSACPAGGRLSGIGVAVGYGVCVCVRAGVREDVGVAVAREVVEGVWLGVLIGGALDACSAVCVAVAGKAGISL